MAGLHKPTTIRFLLEDAGNFTNEEIEYLRVVKETLEQDFDASDVGITYVNKQAAFHVAFHGREQRSMNIYSEFVNNFEQMMKEYFLICEMKIDFHESEHVNKEGHYVYITMKRK